jgi:hypothetical protein
MSKQSQTLAKQPLSDIIATQIRRIGLLDGLTIISSPFAMPDHEIMIKV